jgi:hypothetical protein
MAKPKLNDLRLFLDDLLRERTSSDPPEKKTRKELLRSLPSGDTYVVLLAQKHLAIIALPPAVLGLPLVDLLKYADSLYDGFGKFIYYLGEAYKAHPTLPRDIVEAAEDLQETFAPSLSIFTANYADEAARAKALRPKLIEKKALLTKFSLPDGTTLFDVAVGHIDNGEKLQTLLSERSDASDADRSGAGQLLSNTLGIIRRCRDMIVDMLAANASLPRDLDRQIFGFLDDLAQRRVTSTPSEEGEKAPPKE